MPIIDATGQGAGLSKIFQRLYNNEVSQDYMAKMASEYGDDVGNFLRGGVEKPLSFTKPKDPIQTSVDGKLFTGSNAGTTGRLLWENIKAHPFKSAGIGLGTAANVAGLFDNDKIGGQLVGGGLGALAGVKLLPMLMGGPATIPNVTLAALGGGTLGSLFDKLRAKKAEEEAAMAQYASQGNFVQ
jgi:hypothetical protein